MWLIGGVVLLRWRIGVSGPRRYRTGVIHSRVRSLIPRMATRPLETASSTPRPRAMALWNPRANATAPGSEISYCIAATALTPPRTWAAGGTGE
jgi:hypothetical protein